MSCSYHRELKYILTFVVVHTSCIAMHSEIARGYKGGFDDDENDDDDDMEE
jgi:hypothetical protein